MDKDFQNLLTEIRDVEKRLERHVLDQVVATSDLASSIKVLASSVELKMERVNEKLQVCLYEISSLKTKVDNYSHIDKTRELKETELKTNKWTTLGKVVGLIALVAPGLLSFFNIKM